MSFEQDVYMRSHEKLAGLMDSLGGLIGNNGSLSTPLSALGGAALGGMAGHSLGPWGMGVGAALGGALGGIGANAINSQNMYQNMNDAALINGISAGLNANDQTDMMQNQAIAQTNDTVNQLVGIVGDMMQNNMGTMGGMDPSMTGGMDPSMTGGMPPMDQGGMMPPPDMGGMPPMDQGGMMPPPPPSAPMTNQVANNGLGATKQSSYPYSAYLFDLADQTSMEKTAVRIPPQLIGGAINGIGGALQGAALGAGAGALKNYLWNETIKGEDLTADDYVDAMKRWGTAGAIGNGLLGAGAGAIMARPLGLRSLEI